MSEMHALARWHINADALDEAIELAKKAVAAVREKDPGTTRFDFFLSKDKRTVTVLETYENSEALLAHMANSSDIVGAMVKLGSIELEAFGEPSEELLDAAPQVAPSVHAPIVTL